MLPERRLKLSREAFVSIRTFKVAEQKHVMISFNIADRKSCNRS